MKETAAEVQNAVACRHDCRYYSSYTNTCDYSLIMYRSRGCPRDACTRYTPRQGAQPLPRITYEPEDMYYHAAREMPVAGIEEGEPMYMPEPPVTPPEDDRYIVAGCGHEVYEGEELFEWEDGSTLCGDCLSDRFEEMSLVERAELLGCEHRTVSFSRTSL